MEYGNACLVANRTLREAVKQGLDRPPYPNLITSDWVTDFLKYRDSYSRYRRKFEYLLEWTEDNLADISIYIKQDIQEINLKIESLQTSNDPDLKAIQLYQSYLDRKNSYLKDITKAVPLIQSTLNHGFAEITCLCEKLYTLCIEQHNDQNSFYERGLTYYDQGKFLESIADVSKFLDTGQMIPNSDNASDLFLAQGKCYSDLALYNEAIEALTNAIHANSENREAYLERAAAYFELGDFDNSIQDFLTSGYRTTPLDSSKLDYAVGFFAGAYSVLKDAFVEFFPGLLNSAKGLSTAIWSLAISPEQFSEDVWNACSSFIQFISNHPTPEILEAISPKLRTLFYDRDSLTSYEIGEYLGHLISKNGIEFFAAVGAMKAYREMRKANMIMTLETLATSKPKVIEKSAQWSAKHAEAIKKMRVDEAFVKSLRKQNLSESAIRKTLHELGYKTFPRPKVVPENFKVNFSQKNFGMEYVDPKNPHTSFRVMPGDPGSPNPWQHEPYVIHKKNSKFLDIDGNEVERKSREAHISLEKLISKQ
jgi:tetratricopeptide (TPR) repeat protein